MAISGAENKLNKLTPANKDTRLTTTNITEFLFIYNNHEVLGFLGSSCEEAVYSKVDST
jgi:hypothetical protein